MEEYKCILEDYEISNFGNCRRKMKKGGYKNVKGCIASTGYRYFQVYREGKRINKLFHHLVAKAFIGERPEGLVIDHIDRNKLNNNVSNLRYVSQKENIHNSSTYRTDITTNDPKERKRIIHRESASKPENKEKKRKWCESNKEHITEYHKEYGKKYYEAKRDKIAEKANQKYTCECGGRYTLTNKCCHKKTKKHLNHLALHTPPID